MQLGSLALPGRRCEREQEEAPVRPEHARGGCVYAIEEPLDKIPKDDTAGASRPYLTIILVWLASIGWLVWERTKRSSASEPAGIAFPLLLYWPCI